MKPRVALESTIYAFGLPEQEALALGDALNSIIEEKGAQAVPIAIVQGVPQIGFNENVLQAVCRGKGFVKVNSRDLGAIKALKGNGATTVSGTCALAAQAGIRFFATGGIGGVHRGAEDTFDESLDLAALQRFPVAVVSAGAKAILDLPKTLERLETLGVPVWGYKTKCFPEFYTRGHAHHLEWNFDNLEDLANALAMHWESNPSCGVLICNPIPAHAALDHANVQSWLKRALNKAAKENIYGKALTPYLLQQLAQESKGQTVVANLELIKHNASVAAQLALAFSQRKSQ